MDCPGPPSLKEKLGLKHIERSVFVERRYTLVHKELFSAIKDEALCFELCKANAPDAPHGYYLSPPKASAIASTSLCVVLSLIP